MFAYIYMYVYLDRVYKSISLPLLQQLIHPLNKVHSGCEGGGDDDGELSVITMMMVGNDDDDGERIYLALRE